MCVWFCGPVSVAARLQLSSCCDAVARGLGKVTRRPPGIAA